MKKYSSAFFYIFSDDFDWVKKNIDLEKKFVSCLGAIKIIKDGWETEAIPKISGKDTKKIGFFAKIFRIH